MADVISDAGPLIALAKIDSLFIPKALFARIRIPETVWLECGGRKGEDSRRIERAVNEGWLQVVPAAAGLRLSPGLGSGEAEAIRLALHTPDALLILDDRLARREALRHGLDFIGSARMPHLAEQRLLIDSAEVAVRRMSERGYRISPLLVRQIRAGPAPTT